MREESKVTTGFLNGWKRALSLKSSKPGREPGSHRGSVSQEQSGNYVEVVQTDHEVSQDYPRISVNGSVDIGGDSMMDASSSEITATLEYMTSYGGKMTFVIEQSKTYIGRHQDCQLVLTDAKISKKHACIVRKNGEFAFCDLNSSNGARVNNVVLEPGKSIKLQENDVITLGAIRLTFHLNDANNSATQIPIKASPEEDLLKLVVMMPNKTIDALFSIKAEVDPSEEQEYLKANDVTSVSSLKDDYEKLRVSHELSKIVTVNGDISPHLEKALELIFDVLPMDRAVVLLLDQTTGTLASHYVKLRSPGLATKEIILSSAILKKVYDSRKSLLFSSTEDVPNEFKVKGIICVPLLAHNKMLGVLHMDTYKPSTINTKDLSLVSNIINETALALETSLLMKETQASMRLTEQLHRFLSPSVVQTMRKETVQKGVRLLTGTILIAEIKGLSTLSGKIHPIEFVQMLNDYFERLSKIVFKYNGTVDKIVGDGLMAVFGAIEEDPEPEYRAILASIEFRKAVAEMNADRARASKEPFSFGVGIHTGEATIGFIGLSSRLEFACIGESVSTATRLGSIAKHDQILISEPSFIKVEGRVEASQTNGKTNEILYEILNIIPGGERKRLPPLQVVQEDTPEPIA